MLDFLTMLWKELVQVSNRGRFSVQKMLIGALVCGIFILMSYSIVYDRGGATFQDMASFGSTFLYVLIGVLMPLLSLAALVFASGVVVAEKVRHRLALLLVTPLGASAIIGSKAAGVYIRVLAGLLIALPAAAMLQLFGGVDRAGVLRGLVFIVSNVWLYGAVGLFASVVARTAAGAIVLGAVITVFWNLVPFFYFLFQQYTRAASGARFAMSWVYSLSPIVMFVSYLETSPSVGREMVVHAVANALVGAAFLALALILFRSTSRRLVSGAPARRDLRRAKRASAPRPRRSPFLRFSQWLDDCIMAKEMLHWRPWRSLVPLGWFGLIWGVVISVSLAFGEAPDLYDDNFQWSLFLFEAVGFFFLLSLMGATRIAGEHEARTLQVLIMTRLTALRIILGKAGSLLVEQSLPIFILAAHLAFIMYIDVPDAPAATVKVVGFLVTIAFCAMLGVYFSLAARTAAHAVVLTALTWFLGIIAAAFPVILVGELLFHPGSREWTWALAIIFSLLALLGILVTLTRGRRRGHGLILAFFTYSTIAAALVAGIAATSDTGVNDDDLAALVTLLPASSLLPWDWQMQSISVPLLMLPVQVALLVWMFFASVLTFDAQARREYLSP